MQAGVAQIEHSVNAAVPHEVAGVSIKSCQSAKTFGDMVPHCATVGRSKKGE